MVQISGRLPTTAQANYFIRQLKKLEQLRAIIVGASRAVEQVYDYSEGDDVIAPLEQFVWQIRSGQSDDTRAKGLGSFEIPSDNDPNTLLGDRYVCRGHACMFVGGSGMGKSTMAYQASICWALGKPFLGIKVTHPKGWLTSVHFQSEDEEGDIAEVRECSFSELKLTADEIALVNQRVIIITEKVLRGEEFIADMAVTATRLNADFVWINPLHAFLSGDIKDAKVVGDFCRGGLNAANRESKWAYMICHHTPKPQAQVGKDPKEKDWNEVMYEGAGSADLVNFCRAVIVLKATKDQGQFNLYLAKRGKKADVRIEKESESTGNLYLELTTKIPCRHSQNKITFPGRKKETHVMFWEGRDADKPVVKGGVRQNSGRKSDFADGEYLEMFPASNADPEDLMGINRRAVQQMQVSKFTLSRNKIRLTDEGYLQPFPNGGMKRTDKGDVCVNEYLKTRK